MSRLPDSQQEIVDHLRGGARLVGPVELTRAFHHQPKRLPWAFDDGRRVRKISVDALIRRGVITAREEHDGRRIAELQEARSAATGTKQEATP